MYELFIKINKFFKEDEEMEKQLCFWIGRCIL